MLTAALVSFVYFIPGLLGLAIPYITEAVTTSDVDPRVKSVINIALSLLAGVIPTIALVGGVAGIGPYFVNVLVAWILSGRVYLSKLIPSPSTPEVDLDNRVDTP